MEKFSIRRNNRAEILVTAENLVSEGEKLGIDVARLGLPQKIRSIKESVEGDISIVLLGSFSDGKTSTIAGFSGQVLANMKIDTDESSDQLEHYKIPGNAGFEFVDTPGLFGTKEKEIDGASVSYSEVTKRYISEAHIVVYLCDAGVPLKESHVPVVRKVLRDFGKLESTVFVLNKMDEAGYDLLDEEDFREGCEIKKNALIKRLKDTTIGLTAEEEARLRIVCIAAAPKGKGLEYWLADKERAENYLRRSHIGDFRKAVQEVIDGTDEEKVRSETVTSGVKDVLFLLKEGLSVMVDPLKRGLQRCTTGEIDKMYAELESELEEIRKDLEEKLNTRESSLKEKVSGAGDVEALSTVLHDDIGMDGEKVDLGRVRDGVLGLLSAAKSASESRIKRYGEKIAKEISRQEKALGAAAKESETQLQCVRGEDASEVCGVLSSACAEFKKPTDWSGWASVITGGLGVGGGAVLGATGFGVVLAGLAIAGLRHWKKNEDKKVLEETKPKVVGGLENFFREVRQEYCGDAFYEKFAPGCAKLRDTISGYKASAEEKGRALGALEAYGKKLEAALPKLGVR